jgi:hypothetical protein
MATHYPSIENHRSDPFSISAVRVRQKPSEKQSVKRLGGDVGQGWSKLLKVGQSCSELFKAVQGCSKLFKVVQSCSRLFKVVQGCSKLFRVGQGCSKLLKVVQYKSGTRVPISIDDGSGETPAKK